MTDTTVQPTVSRRVAVFSRLPERILQLLVGLFLATSSLAAFGIYKPYTVLPLAVVLCALSWRFLPTDLAPSLARARGSLIALGAVVLWILVQAPFATQYIVASRDPGIYTNVAVQLARTGHTSIDVSQAVKAAAGIPGVSGAPGIFAYESDLQVRLQGGSGFPSMLGLGYWIAGVHGLIVVNLVLGGIALLAVFAVGRRFLGPVWSILPPVILAVSMPFTYFARGPYTEIVSLALFFAAIAWLWSAFRTGRLPEFFFAGVLAGATSETRIDGVLGVAAMVVAFLLVVLGIARPRVPFSVGRAFAAFAVPAVLITALSVYDFETNFHTYVHNLGSQTRALWVLFAFVVILVAVVLLVQRVVALARSGREAPFLLGGALGDTAASRLGFVLGAIVPLTFAFWAVRPALFHVHGGNSAGVQSVVEGLQRAAGAAVDGSRTYDEWSLYWFVWYFGFPFLLAAGIGLGLLVQRAVARREPGLLVLTALTFGVSLLYLDKMSITPDQIWAFRRALPLIAPGFVLAAVWPIRLLVQRFRKRSIRWGRVVGAVGMVLVVGGTLSAWTPQTLGSVNGNGQADEIADICARIGTADDVVLVNLGPDPYGLSLKTFCGVNVLMVSTGPDPAASEATTTSRLKVLATRIGAGTPVLTFNPATVPWEGSAPQPFRTTDVRYWAADLIGAPKDFIQSPRSGYLGSLTSAGTVAPR